MLPNPNRNRNLNPNPELNLPRDGEVARVLPARAHLLPRGFGLGLGLGFALGSRLGSLKYHANPRADLLPCGGALHHGVDEARGARGRGGQGRQARGRARRRAHVFITR